MNYAGKFDGAISSDGPGNHSHFVHLNPGHIHAPADAIVVPDAHFLFNADFKRSGVDLVLSSDDHELVLHEYFKGEKHKALASPDGAHLTGELVDALTGHVELAQAGGAVAAASAVIGHITKMQGSATVIRNGVSIILNMGDNVEKGDVVQSGSNSSVGITFIDGTVFGLSSNAKMVLNEMVYDPNGSNNSSLISLVAGTITFVAGETAKRGDMKIDTPVATMGIRGTAVLVEIDFSVPGANGAPNASFQVLVEPDGTTGSYILFDKATMQPLAIVNQAGQQININNGVISQTQNPLTPQMQQLINEVFSQKFTDNSTTKTTSPTGSSTPDGTTYQLKYADAAQQQTTTQGTGNNQQDKPTAPGGPGGQGTQHVAGAPIASFTSVQLFFIERPGLTGSSALDQMKFTVGFSDPNPGDTPTVRADFTGFTLKDAAGHDVPLSPLAQQDVLAAEIDLNPALVAAAGNANNGSTDVLYSLVDKDFDFLAQGQSITLSYVITVNNNYGPAPEVTKQTVTFTIFGTNDVPVIADDKLTQLIEFKGGTSTPGGTLTVLNGEATGGTYDFKDPDLTDTHWIVDANKDPAINHTADPNASDRFNSVHKAALTSASLTLPDGTTLDKAGLEALAPGPMSVFEQALDVNVSTDSTGTGNGEISWQLENLPVFLADFIPVGETLKLYYTIEVTDENGATDTKVVEVDITGTNAAATVWVHTTDDGHDGNWTTGANWGTGKAPTSVDDVIIVTDQLHPHTPAYPATITTGTNAAAHSVVMNDFVVDNTQPVPQTIPPELKLETGSSLTIGTTLVMSADSILTNAGTVNIGTQLELKDDATNPVTPVNESVINNSGTINIGQGGDIQGVASVTNSGTIDLKSGTLNLDVNVANSANGSGGDIIVESGAKLVLGGDVNTGKRGGVTGGTVTVNGGGELDLTGVNTLSSGTLSNTGQVNVSGLNNILSGETVSNTGTASAIDITGVLTAQNGTDDRQPGCDERRDDRERRHADAEGHVVDLGRSGHQRGDAEPTGHDGLAVGRQADQHPSGQRLRQQQCLDGRTGAQHRHGERHRHHRHADGADRNDDCQPGRDERGDDRERRHADAEGHVVDLGRSGHQRGDAEPSGHDGLAVGRQADQHSSGQRLRQQQCLDGRTGAQHRHGERHRHHRHADGADRNHDCQPGRDIRRDGRERRHADAEGHVLDLGRSGHQQGHAGPSGHDGVAVGRQADQHRSGQRLRQQQCLDRRAGAQHRHGERDRHHGDADGADRDDDRQPGHDLRRDDRKRRHR